MTVDQHHRVSTPPISHLAAITAPTPVDLAQGIRTRRFRYEPGHHTPTQDDPAMWHGPITTDVPDDPAAHAAAQHLLLLVGQVLNRRRPATHLGATAAVVRYVRAITPLGGLVRIGTLHVRMPREGAAEVVVVCRFGTRCVRVIAARLNDCPGAGWQCTAFRLL